MNSLKLNVDNLANQEEKTQIKNALDKIKGVQKVSVSLQTGLIAVDYNDPADKGMIKDCVEKIGFHVT